MSERRLFDTMEARVEADCRRIREKASEEAGAILSEARDAAAARREAALKVVREEVDAEMALARRRADARAAVMALALRQRVADEVLDRAAAHLRQLAGKDGFGETVVALLAEAMEAAEGAARVLAPEAHVDRCRAWLDQNGFADTPVDADENVADGIVVAAEDGSWRVENTLTRRFERLRPEARKQCVARLFAEDS